MLRIGKITIVKIKDGLLWMRHDDGEAMELREDKFCELVEKFFREEF